MARIPVNGVELDVEQVGEGPVALVLHGGMGLDKSVYRSLDPLTADLRLVYYDHRGNGRSGGAESSLSMAQWAADAAELARIVGGGEPVIVIGHSFGGFIAQEMAVAHGDVIRALLLLATTPGQLGTGEEPAPEGPPIPEEFAALLSHLPTTDEELAVGMNLLADPWVHTDVASDLRAAMADTVFRAAACRIGFEQLAEWSSVDRLGAVTAPVLLVAGRQDAFTSWPQSERIAARLDDAEVVILDDSGHFLWFDEPDAFFTAVRDWLRRKHLVG
jgi:proline iminopeptidase